mgnify:CR=1 FL=1
MTSDPEVPSHFSGATCRCPPTSNRFDHSNKIESGEHSGSPNTPSLSYADDDDDDDNDDDDDDDDETQLAGLVTKRARAEKRACAPIVRRPAGRCGPEVSDRKFDVRNSLV